MVRPAPGREQARSTGRLGGFLGLGHGGQGIAPRLQAATGQVVLAGAKGGLVAQRGQVAFGIGQVRQGDAAGRQAAARSLAAAVDGWLPPRALQSAAVEQRLELLPLGQRLLAASQLIAARRLPCLQRADKSLGIVGGVDADASAASRRAAVAASRLASAASRAASAACRPAARRAGYPREASVACCARASQAAMYASAAWRGSSPSATVDAAFRQRLADRAIAGGLARPQGGQSRVPVRGARSESAAAERHPIGELVDRSGVGGEAAPSASARPRRGPVRRRRWPGGMQPWSLRLRRPVRAALPCHPRQDARRPPRPPGRRPAGWPPDSGHRWRTGWRRPAVPARRPRRRCRGGCGRADADAAAALRGRRHRQLRRAQAPRQLTQGAHLGCEPAPAGTCGRSPSNATDSAARSTARSASVTEA